MISLLPMFNNWKGGIVTIFSIEELERGVHPQWKNLNSGIETRLAIEELGRGIHPPGKILYIFESYFLRQLPYENTTQYPCKVVKALSNWGKNSPPQIFQL